MMTVEEAGASHDYTAAFGKMNNFRLRDEPMTADTWENYDRIAPRFALRLDGLRGREGTWRSAGYNDQDRLFLAAKWQVDRRTTVRAEYERRGTVGDERAIGALQRPCDKRVLDTLAPAKLETEVLAHLRIGIFHAVLVVLCGDHRQCVGLISVSLEVLGGDHPKNPGETAGDLTVFRQV